ncbi:MAG: DUF2934 domain-containing protein [Methylotenera sp.]|nr:DUF2934 domain-containing protein [Methylotenera sp.]MDO9234398.1 DUF2934 domain-containing protein [Methylotenera sp.]MDO9389166.1 DUF2934 domain-containing protein [Methylotenera sp.]MDP1595585.1 DUF2934 domain-containing protein [Methylotenera sp.]MDP1755035.1 DUF2934 domain-containing protein [Methylotenera sp.]
MTQTKKPVVKKAAASDTSVEKAAPKPRAKKVTPILSNQERYEIIQKTAYYIAEHNGFVGDPHAFWAEAEAQIDALKS